MLKPIGTLNPSLDSGNAVLTLLVEELRGKTLRPVACNTPGELHAALTKVCKREHIKFCRTNLIPLSQEGPAKVAAAHAWARAALRAGDWVICCQGGGENPPYQLAYGLEEGQVLLAGGKREALTQWQQEVEYYWLVTLTFAKGEVWAPENPCGVRWLQRRLNLVEQAGLEEDGVYGPATAQAVAQFSRHWAGRGPGSVLPLEEELARQLAI